VPRAVPLQSDVLVDSEQLCLRCVLSSLDLAHAGQILQTELVTLTEQLDRLGAQSQRRLGRIPDGKQMNQIGVGRGHRGRQDQAGLRDLGLCGQLFRRGRSQRRAVLAPEIQFPRQIQVVWP
jgi:hypothetical protein